MLCCSFQSGCSSASVVVDAGVCCGPCKFDVTCGDAADVTGGAAGGEDGGRPRLGEEMRASGVGGCGICLVVCSKEARVFSLPP